MTEYTFSILVSRSILILFCMQSLLDVFFCFLSKNPWIHHTINHQFIFSSFLPPAVPVGDKIISLLSLRKQGCPESLNECILLPFANVRRLYFVWRHACNIYTWKSASNNDRTICIRLLRLLKLSNLHNLVETGHISVLPVCVAVPVCYGNSSFTSAFHTKNQLNKWKRMYGCICKQLQIQRVDSLSHLAECDSSVWLIFGQIQIKTTIVTVAIQLHKHSIYMQLWRRHGPGLQEFYRETQIARTGSVNRNSKRR